MNPNSGIDLVNRQKQEFAGLLGRQRDEENQLFSDFTNRVNSQAKLPDVLRQAQNERGLGELQNNINLFQGQVSNVKGMLDRLPENLRQRTAGTFTTQSLLDRQNAVEGGDLRTQLSRLAAGMEPVVQAYQLASGDIGQLLEATARQQERELSPLTERLRFVSDRFAREMTGFSEGSQNELSALLDRLQRDRQLNDREYQRASELAAQEREYELRKRLLAEETQAKNSAPRPLPGAESLVQKFQNNGQTIGYDTNFRSVITPEGLRQEQEQEANARFSEGLFSKLSRLWGG